MPLMVWVDILFLMAAVLDVANAFALPALTLVRSAALNPSTADLAQGGPPVVRRVDPLGWAVWVLGQGRHPPALYASSDSTDSSCVASWS